MAYGILIPCPGIEPRPGKWKCWVLTTGPPGNSQGHPALFFKIFIWLCLVVVCGIQFSDQGLNVGSLHWECRVLAIGPAGKSRHPVFLKHSYWDWHSWRVRRMCQFSTNHFNTWILFLLTESQWGWGLVTTYIERGKYPQKSMVMFMKELNIFT